MNRAEIVSAIRREIRREMERLTPALKACAHIKSALDVDVPDRGADPEAHDGAVVNVHGNIKAGMGYLEQHPEFVAQLAKRLRGVADYADELDKGLAHLKRAGDEADRFPDVAGTSSEGDCVNTMHKHCSDADQCFENYRAGTYDPDAEKSRSRARAWAAAIKMQYGTH